MKKYLYICLLLFLLRGNSYAKKDNIFVAYGFEFGYLNSDLSELNMILYPNFNDISYSIKKNHIIDKDGKVKKKSQYSFTPTIGLTLKTRSYNNLSFDISVKYHFLKKQYLDTNYIKRGKFEGINLLAISNNEEDDQFQELEKYKFGFKLNLYSFTIIPYYMLLNKNLLQLSLGAGIINTIGILNQSGIQCNVNSQSIIYSDTDISNTSFKIGLLPSIKLQFNFSSKITLNYVCSYSIQGKINTFKNEFTYSNSGIIEEIFIVPLIKTENITPEFNLNGFHQSIGINYYFNLN